MHPSYSPKYPPNSPRVITTCEAFLEILLYLPPQLVHTQDMLNKYQKICVLHLRFGKGRLGPNQALIAITDATESSRAVSFTVTEKSPHTTLDGAPDTDEPSVVIDMFCSSKGDRDGTSALTMCRHCANLPLHHPI